jgi:hypothetical protein
MVALLALVALCGTALVADWKEVQEIKKKDLALADDLKPWKVVSGSWANIMRGDHRFIFLDSLRPLG